jgi:16S rRNA C967 or C1407 C5-methylase (RsmB/RsmF family)
MRGGSVCVVHGGKSPQALRKAEERLKSLVHPAITGLAELIAAADSDSVRLSAIKDLLDRTGHKPAERVQQEGRVVIEIEMVDRVSPSQIRHALESPPQANGVRHAADS